MLCHFIFMKRPLVDYKAHNPLLTIVDFFGFAAESVARVILELVKRFRGVLPALNLRGQNLEDLPGRLRTRLRLFLKTLGVAGWVLQNFEKLFSET